MRFIRVCTYVIVVCATASTALADGTEADLAKEVAQRIEVLQAALKKKDTDAIGDGITGVALRYEDVTDTKLRDKMRKAIGKACRSSDKDVQHMAIDAFSRMGDPAACRYLLPFVKQGNAKKEPPLFDPAMRAIETLQPDSAVPTLLTLVKKSKHLGIAARAMEVLGAYKSSKVKGKILDTIISTVRKEKPGVKGRENPNWYGANRTGAQARNRWEALAAPMVRTANSLTGQDIGSPVEWFGFYTKHKRKPELLFQAH